MIASRSCRLKASKTRFQCIEPALVTLRFQAAGRSGAAGGGGVSDWRSEKGG